MQPKREWVSLSKNDRPLAFHVERAYITNVPQFGTVTKYESIHETYPNGATYHFEGPLKYTNAITCAPQHSAIIVEFKVMNVSRPLLMNRKEFQLFDGKGGVHEAEFVRDYSATDPKTIGNAWSSSEHWYIDPPEHKSPNSVPETAMFKDIPDSAIEGSSIHFQGTVYPLSVSKQVQVLDPDKGPR
jgi:hypothetical protein